MRTHPTAKSRSVWACLVLLCLFAAPLSAEQFGLFRYSITEDTVRIDDYPKNEVGEVEIPAEIDGKPVTEIRYEAFQACSGLTSVTIPGSVTTIGNRAFRYCSGLTSVTIPDSVTIIGDDAFDSCSGLTSVTIPGSVTTIGGEAFGGCSGLTFVTISEGVTTIRGSAFRDCSGLTSVTIPGSVTEIGPSVFSGCSGLTSVTISEGVTTIGDYAFWGCSGLTSATIPGSVITIGERAFEGCSSLTSVTIPGSVTTIGDYAFRDCSSLTSIEVDALNPNYSSLDGVLFDQERTRLIQYPEGKAGDYTIPGSVTRIGGSAFEGGNGLTSVTIPAGVTAIGRSAFEGCSGLTSVAIPGSVTEIGDRAFEGCSGLPSVTIPGSVTEIGYEAFSGCSGLTFVTLSEGVTTIGGSAFRDCSGLTSVTIPGSVTYIGSAAFRGCSGLTSIEVDALNLNYSSLDGVLFDQERTWLIQYPEEKAGDYTIPGSVTEIGERALSGCSGLTSVTIPGSVTYIDNAAFRGCSSLTSIEVDALNPNYSSLDGVLFDQERTRLIQYPEGKAGDYTMPGSVTEIGDEAFEGCSGLTSVAIPGSVTEIGERAFSGCSGLISVTLSEGVIWIGGAAFSGCSGLRSAIFLGDAPRTVGRDTFTNTAPRFTIFYLGDSSGFTSPAWNGYPAVRIDEQARPAAAWLVGHNLPYDTDLHLDLNGDGVNLLMAYALDLDPNQNLQGSLPLPVLGDGSLSISFHAASEGITYTVQTSTDLQAWTTEGVTLSEMGPEGKRTAWVDSEGVQRFIRLLVAGE